VDRGLSSVVIGIILFAACELEEIAIPSGDEVFIVHAVMRPDQQRQFVLVERSWRGHDDPADLDNFGLPPNSPQLPLIGAMVTVSNLDFPGDPCGSAVMFDESAPGLYRGPGNCPTMRPGDELELEILVPSGEAIRGTTEVVELDSAWVQGAFGAVPFGAPDSLVFNRDTDTLRFAVYGSHGRLVEIQFNRLDYYGNLSTSGFDRSSFLADTNDFIVPGSILDLLERGEGDEVLRAGRRYMMTVAMTDANYFDFVRSRNNSVTGRGFINHLQGAVGVFGSLAALPLIVDVVGEADDSREGVYRLTGIAASVTVDATLSMYLRHPVDSAESSGFLRGVWLQETEQGWQPWNPKGLSVDGQFVGSAFDIVVEQPLLDRGERPGTTLVLAGTWAADSFEVTVRDETLSGGRILGVLTAVKVP
jgi:hypothetical protein